MTLLVSEGNWGRVRLPDGDEGWVLLKLVKPGDDPPAGEVSDATQAKTTDLERRLIDLESALAAAQADREALEAAQAENVDLERRLSDAQSAIATALAAAQADSEALEAAQAENADLERRLVDANSALAAAQATAQENREALETAEAEKVDLERRLGDASSELAAAQARAQEDREALETAHAEKADFERRLGDASSELAAAQARPQENREASETAHAEKVDLERRLVDATSALAAAEAGAQESREALGTVQAENDDLELTVAAFETAADDDAARIADLTDRLRAAEIFFEESAIQRLELTEEVATLRRENEELRKQPAQAESMATLPLQQPVDPPRADELWTIVQDWARAWSEQRTEDYLSFYVSNFEPESGLSRKQWESQRRARLARPNIRVDVAFLEIRLEAPDRPEIEFVQSYSSDSFEDVVVKTLGLLREDGAWKIASERVK